LEKVAFEFSCLLKNTNKNRKKLENEVNLWVNKKREEKPKMEEDNSRHLQIRELGQGICTQQLSQ